MVSIEYQKLKGGDFTSFMFGGGKTSDKFMTWIGYRREQSVDELVDFMKGKTLMSEEDINDSSSHHHYPKDCSGFVWSCHFSSWMDWNCPVSDDLVCLVSLNFLEIGFLDRNRSLN